MDMKIAYSTHPKDVTNWCAPENPAHKEPLGTFFFLVCV